MPAACDPPKRTAVGWRLGLASTGVSGWRRASAPPSCPPSCPANVKSNVPSKRTAKLPAKLPGKGEIKRTDQTYRANAPTNVPTKRAEQAHRQAARQAARQRENQTYRANLRANVPSYHTLMWLRPEPPQDLCSYELTGCAWFQGIRIPNHL